MFYLNLREMHRNPTYCWDLPAEGLEPTRSCDHWILSPARLPIPPRRRQASSSYEAGVIPQALQTRSRDCKPCGGLSFDDWCFQRERLDATHADGSLKQEA